MVKTFEDYLPAIQDEYPDIPKEVLIKIIRGGISRLQYMVNRDHDVRFGNNHPGRNYTLTFTRPISDQKRRNIRAKLNRMRLDSMRENYKGNE